MSASQFVQVEVGGLPYSIAVSDIERFPGSFFECMIKKEWMKDDKPVVIERDGALFKYVNAFLITGCLPRDSTGKIALDDATLQSLQVEADFFGISTLSEECGVIVKRGKSDLEGFITIRKYLQGNHHNDGFTEVDYSSSLISALKEVWTPFCVKSKIRDHYCTQSIFKSSTIQKVNINELIAAATQSAFGRGTETVTDTSVRNSFEIPVSELNAGALKNLSYYLKGYEILAPHLKPELRPYKLVIYKEGGHFHEHRDTVRGEGHIGTLVVILNSAYTGGELEVTHDGRTEIVTGAYSWVAMYGDCLHKINPVTFGTRVSLIYDIYGAARGGEEDEEEKNENEDDEEEGEEASTVFWEHQNAGRNTPGSDHVRDVSAKTKTRIVDEARAELKSLDSLVITLQHLYPECQTSPAFLKGGDRALYDLLSEQFDVEVVAARIYRSSDPDNGDEETTFSLFAPAVLRDGLGKETDDCQDAKKRRLDPPTTKLVITNQFDRDGLLDYTPFIEHTGNESQAEETVYIVAGLQVRKRAV